MSSKSLYPVSNLIIVFLLAGCIPASPTSTVPPVASPPTASTSGPLSASFTQSEYHMGDTLEFTAQWVNQQSAPVATSLSLIVEGKSVNGLPVATIEYPPVKIWTKSEEITLEAGQSQSFTYQLPYETYAAIGTGDYFLKAEVGGHSVTVQTVVTSVFDVEVMYPAPLTGGQIITVQASVTNASDFDAHDVEVSGSIAGMNTQSLGTLPAHNSKTITWTVTVRDSGVFDPLIFVSSSNGGNTTVAPPSTAITPI